MDTGATLQSWASQFNLIYWQTTCNHSGFHLSADSLPPSSPSFTVYHLSSSAEKHSERQTDKYLLDLHMFLDRCFPLLCLSSSSPVLVGWLLYMKWSHECTTISQVSPLRGVCIRISITASAAMPASAPSQRIVVWAWGRSQRGSHVFSIKEEHWLICLW